MPKFTITRDGKSVSQVDAHGERIEIGSARSCQVLIDDLLISLKQAALVRTSGIGPYQIEPVSRVPAFTLNGNVVETAIEVSDGAVVGLEGYLIKIDYLPGELASATPSPSARPSALSSMTPESPAIPPALEPDLPPPLEISTPSLAAPEVKESPSPQAQSANVDMERTVFVRRVGKLVATSGPLNGQHWDLKSGETRIGRESGQNDIVIRFDRQGNVDNSISRRHASVHVSGDKILVEDAGSAAGTFVNGTVVPPRQRIEVRANDLIEIRSSRESTILRVDLDRVGAPATPAPQAVAPTMPTPAPESVRVAAPHHESPSPGDFGVDEPVVARRRRREVAAADNIFVPVEEPKKSGKIPTWGWIVAGVGVILLIVIILLIAM